MNIYVESNFVLELALRQEQHASCEALLRLCEVGDARLIVPAYALTEPYETLGRRHKERKRLKTELDNELRQLARTTVYEQQLSNFQTLTTLLIDSAGEEIQRLEEVRDRLLETAEIISLEAAILIAATQYRRTYMLSPQDALVYATVLSHLQQSRDAQSCFLNRNARDFDDPELTDELSTYNCKLLTQFDTGYQFVRSQLSQGGA